VRGRHDAQLDAAAPERVVVVRAVEAEAVDALARARAPGRQARLVRRRRGRVDRPMDEPLIMIAFMPSVPTACSSSAIASSGVCIGMCAAGVMRSA
jgi:hypothetical protein